MAPRKQRRAPRRKALPRRPARRLRRARDVPDIAKCSERKSLATPAGTPNFVMNQSYSLMNTQLIDYDRAADIAANYQSYRIKKITLTVKPPFDSYTLAGGMSKPTFYYMIDKQGALPFNINLAGLKSAGAKPIALDEKPLSISWRPSVLEAVMYQPAGVGQLTASKYRISPWLSCNSLPLGGGAFIASGLDHLGIYWYVDCTANPGAATYTVECEVQFEFKKPANYGLVTTTAAEKAQIAQTDDSKDGIVGTDV